ncbi:hypothetical protein [Brazilian marseillevirus]|uniref:hypothetical protein n=1 Tax=Brazilian marseillevirus TaxID=1813599 RepID=UPI000783C901|nr:hypothetical protein A3303_gp115 [Brazilian marseillevirus]AMQ10623.1 hypothetical protein [Brazilian marseillevirus]
MKKFLKERVSFSIATQEIPKKEDYLVKKEEKKDFSFPYGFYQLFEEGKGWTIQEHEARDMCEFAHFVLPNGEKFGEEIIVPSKRYITIRILHEEEKETFISQQDFGEYMTENIRVKESGKIKERIFIRKVNNKVVEEQRAYFPDPKSFVLYTDLQRTPTTVAAFSSGKIQKKFGYTEE